MVSIKYFIMCHASNNDKVSLSTVYLGRLEDGKDGKYIFRTNIKREEILQYLKDVSSDKSLFILKGEPKTSMVITPYDFLTDLLGAELHTFLPLEDYVHWDMEKFD